MCMYVYMYFYIDIYMAWRFERFASLTPLASFLSPHPSS